MPYKTLSPEVLAMKAELDKFVGLDDLCYNKDVNIVIRVLTGLVARKKKTGFAYCPCRLVTGNPDQDLKIVCPCAYHKEEIETRGACHCNLFVSKS